MTKWVGMYLKKKSKSLFKLYILPTYLIIVSVLQTESQNNYKHQTWFKLPLRVSGEQKDGVDLLHSYSVHLWGIKINVTS